MSSLPATLARQGSPVSAASTVARDRLHAIDVLRGAVMVLMAIDHVRVFAGVPAGGPTPGIFFTRWVTHFCAPVFVFLAGTSAFLHGRRHDDVSRYLLTRGAWLVLLELTFVRLAWTFNLEVTQLMAGVIWAIGWCMVAMAVLVKLPRAALLVLGLAIVAGHDLLDPHRGAVIAAAGEGELGWLWQILYVGFFVSPIGASGDGATLTVLYSIVPWIGVMALGHCFGSVLTWEPTRRKRACLWLGLGATALFLLLRGFDLYGDPQPWRSTPPPGAPPRPWLFAFLGTSKYPASFLFLLMTLGPALALLPALESARGALARVLTVFGRAPLAFYLLHIPLIHALALLVSRLREGTVNPWLFANHPMGAPPAPSECVWSLGLLYLVWAVAIALLYPACRWILALKERRPGRWTSYV